MGLTYHFIDEDWILHCVHGKFTKWYGSMRSALLAKQVPEMWGDLNVKYVAADNAAKMGCMGRYLDKGNAPDSEDPDRLTACGIKMGGCFEHHVDKLFAILTEHTEFDELMRILRSITTNIHKSSQALDHAKACLTVSGKPWNQLDAMVKTHWWSLFTFLDSFMFNIETLRYMRNCPKHPNVPPELYNLTDLLIGDLECAREVAQGIMKAQLNIIVKVATICPRDDQTFVRKVSTKVTPKVSPQSSAEARPKLSGEAWKTLEEIKENGEGKEK